MTAEHILNIRKAIEGETLDDAQMHATMLSVLAGEVSPTMLAGFAVALRMRGIRMHELAAAARAMRACSRQMTFDGAGPLVDTCGTGGDGSGSYNISTVAALIVAACGVRVAKHGNRAVSSKCGSADLLEALGVQLDASDATLRQCMDLHNIAFLFAPGHHGALRYAAPVRRELGVRTFFNMLGPLCNPAGATHQVVGVYDSALCENFAGVLGALGLERAWVVHGHGGLDEVSPYGSTTVARWDGTAVDTFEVHPRDFGLETLPAGAIGGGDATRNARITHALLDGAPSPYRTAVVLNAAAALCVADDTDAFSEATRRAEHALDSGDARTLLNAWVDQTRAGAPTPR
eukprot:GHVR01170267.1.p1 GENE.GHVR01170267.1~~GHVR01170267.1.p1  ORF type:complete len:347 (+),score=70.78 GHVR01170267.1:613-1653(+)